MGGRWKNWTFWAAMAGDARRGTNAMSQVGKFHGPEPSARGVELRAGAEDVGAA